MRMIIKTILVFWVFISEINAESIKEEVLKAKIELGHRLFYDADLSINGTMSCATCHVQKRGFTDGNTMHPGVLGDSAKRNVPGLANIGSFKNLTWAHNNLSGLAEQSLIPIKGTDPIEMGMNGYENEIAKRLSQNECYQKLFLIAFSKEKDSINLNNVTLALESFQKTLISDNSVYDQKIKNQKQLPTKEAQDGEKLFFGIAKCSTCHNAPLFSDDNFHQIQLQKPHSNNKIKDYGLFDITGKVENKNFFRTPSLRNASLTAPYWHDGSAKTFVEAIQKHNLKINQILSIEDINKLIAFIETLTDYSFINNQKYNKPNEECRY